jgi:hypothetical protein
MNYKRQPEKWSSLFSHLLCLALFCVPATLQAQLVVTVSPPNVIGQKAIVMLKMANHFDGQIKFARAGCFLLDDRGEMIGQSAKWVINENLNKTGLPSGATNEFNFVITNPKPFLTTNLTAKVNFSRVVLQEGQLANVRQTVKVVPAEKSKTQ